MRKTVFLAIVIAATCAAAVSGGLLIFFKARESRAAETAETAGVQAGPRVSIPRSGGAESGAGDGYGEALSGDSGVYPAFALEAGETALQVLNTDINLDGTYDQVCAIRRGTESEIYIVCAIQNPVTTVYTRLAPVKTSVTQARTLLMYFSDVTGRQGNALVYSGMNSENLQSLGIFLVEEDEQAQGGFQLKEILNLSADGAIQVEEVRRSEAYNLGMAVGASYPVVSYHSIRGQDGAQSAQQIRRTYAWNPSSGVYELSAETRVSAESAGAMIMQRLREGGNETLFSFLKGIWYKSDGSASDVQIGFDLESDEIIFADGQTHEVFASESVSARRYGVYLVAHNSLISSIRRLVDIEITGADEIQVRATDDVRLTIGVDSNWNGSYRRMRNTASSSPISSAQRIAASLEGSNLGWADASGTVYLFEGNVLTTESTDGGKEESKYTIYMMRENPVMQVKARSGENTFYLLREDADGRIAMQETNASAAGVRARNAPEITLTAIQEESAESQG